MTDKPLLKISRSQQYSITMQLLKKQGGNCLVCNKRINVNRLQDDPLTYALTILFYWRGARCPYIAHVIQQKVG